jgi:tRNA 5-methylaminomethyl-2-thiouridine biosynthesis bifunctional protein
LSVTSAAPLRFGDLEHQAIVVGAGIAGCTLAAVLARRGWHVTVLEQHAGPARETSAHTRAVLHPSLAQDDNLVTRALRAGYLLARRNSGVQPCGVLHIACDSEQARRWQSMLQGLACPTDLASWAPAEASYRLSGYSAEWGGIWYAGGGWASMPKLCREALLVPGVCSQFNTRVMHLARQDGHWHLQTNRGSLSTRVLVLAQAMDAVRLLRDSDLLGPEAEHRTYLPLSSVRGQLSYIKTEPEYLTPRSVLCGSGYYVPPEYGVAVLGATYDLDDPDLGLRDASHEENCANFGRLLGSNLPRQVQLQGGFVGQRCVSRDRRPLIGAWVDICSSLIRHKEAATHLDKLPRLAGLYTNLGLGSHGLIWSALAAELLASQILGEPAPISTDLVCALDPGRFVLRALRRSSKPGPVPSPAAEA